MKNKVITICMCLALLLGILSVPNVNAMAEGKEGVDNSLDITMTVQNTIEAGKPFAFHISVKNVSGKNLVINQIQHDYYNKFDEDGSDSSTEFGSVADAEGNPVSDMVGDDGPNIPIADNEVKEFTWSGTVPDNWTKAYWFYYCVYADEVGNDKQYFFGHAGIDYSEPNEDEEIVEDAFNVLIAADQAIQDGKSNTFTVSIQNKTGVQQSISEIASWYYRDIINNGDSIEEFGKLSDSSGNEITSESALKIEFAANEKKVYKLTGTIPSGWGKNSVISVNLMSLGSDGKWYAGGGVYPDGSISGNITSSEEGTADSSISLPDSQWILKVLSNDELQSGDSYEVIFHTDKAEMESIAAADKELILKAAGNKQIAMILDMTIQKTNTSKNPPVTEDVNELSSPMFVTIQIPQEYYKESGRRFSVIRLHDGAATVLEDLDNQAATVTIRTDRFSYYVLAYTDEPAIVLTSVAGQNAKAARTGDQTSAGIYMALCVLALSAAGILIQKKRTWKK